MRRRPDSRSRGRKTRTGGRGGRGKRRFGSTKEYTKRKMKMVKSGGKYAWFTLPEGAEQWKPGKKGRYKMDILPYEVTVNTHDIVPQGELATERTVKVHRGVGADDKMVVCLKTIGKPCPICENIQQELRQGEITDNQAKEMSAKDRQLFNVLIDDDVKIFESSVHTFGKKLYSEIEETEEETGEDWSGFADLEGGATLLARFVEESFSGNPFLSLDRVDFEEREDFDEDILDECHDLDRALIIHDYDKLNRMFLEAPAQDGEEEEEYEEEPTRRRRTDKRSSKSTKTRKAKNRCPEGGRFGEDYGFYDYCVDCPEQDECAYEKGIDINADDDYEDNEDWEMPEDDGIEECPFGLVWGEDNEADPACDDCHRWERCNIEKQKLESGMRRGGRGRSTQRQRPSRKPTPTRGKTRSSRRPAPTRGGGRKVVKKRRR
jgi:hypothetical protein